jgi:hypothetical protein
LFKKLPSDDAQITVFAFGVGLVSIFGIYEDEQSHFSGFEKAFKRLFWIIFDPGDKLVLHISRVTRWYVFKPKIQIWTNFGGSCN